MPEPMFQKVCVIGLGLIGSSLCHVMRREGLAGHISGHARSRATRDKAVEIGLVDSIHDGAAEAVADADLVIVCVPVGACGQVAAAIGPMLKPGAIVTDVGSVKGHVIAAMAPHMPDGVHFICGHPVAGTEESGPESGFASLFEDRWCILTPTAGTDKEACNRLEAFWKACGSSVERMDPEHHDLVLAITSHVPHLIAYNIVGTAADLEEVTRSEVIKYSAAGFRDFTRIAASDPVMWRDVFLTNRDGVLEMLGRFTEDLTALQRMIRNGDGEALQALFTRTRSIRRGIIDAGHDEPVPDFGRRGEIKPQE
ncbi:MAG: prephenate/arogenate dehydrogenase family protein [Hyphomicrobiales bacterium]